MSEHTKLFQHDGDRTPETDEMAEELAAHALRNAHPAVQDITFHWVRHNQPDCWLLFVSGTTEET
jgi:hypothetical protein